MSEYIPDEYQLQQVERSGYAYPAPKQLRCPVCDEILGDDDMIIEVYGETVGCTICADFVDPIEYFEE